MEGNYPVFYQGRPVGKVQVMRKGLYYSFHCRCRMESGVVCRLIAKWADGWENLGIPVPEGDGLELNRKLPAKRLGERKPEFWLIPHDQDIQKAFSGTAANEAGQEEMLPGNPTAAEPVSPSPTEPTEAPAPEEEPRVTEGTVPGEPAERNPEPAAVESLSAQDMEMTEPARGKEGAEQPAMEENPKAAARERAGAFYPIETDMPFAHLEELEQGILASRDGQTGVLIPKEGHRVDQTFSDSPTGQWSEPITSE